MFLQCLASGYTVGKYELICFNENLLSRVVFNGVFGHTGFLGAKRFTHFSLLKALQGNT